MLDFEGGIISERTRGGRIRMSFTDDVVFAELYADLKKSVTSNFILCSGRYRVEVNHPRLMITRVRIFQH